MESNEGFLFHHSLMPFVFCLKFVGIQLDTHKSPPSFFDAARLFVPVLLGCSMILANLIINGQHGISIQTLTWMEKKLNFDDPFAYIKANPQVMICLVKDIWGKLHFCSVPALHFVFMATILMRNRKWQDVWSILNEIQKRMQLNKSFHSKCRRNCFLALFILAIVSTKEIQQKHDINDD
jgi:hypothetical protein